MAMERVSDATMRTDAEVGRAWDENADLWIRHVRAGWDNPEPPSRALVNAFPLSGQ